MPVLQQSVRFRSVNSIYSRTKLFLPCISRIFEEDFQLMEEFFASWRSKEDFARSGIPSFFLDLLPSYGTISQGQWDERQTFEYRHALNIEEGLFGCLARFRRSYFVYGFTVDAADVLPASEREEWLRPAEVLSIPLARQKKL